MTPFLAELNFFIYIFKIYGYGLSYSLVLHIAVILYSSIFRTLKAVVTYEEEE